MRSPFVLDHRTRARALFATAPPWHPLFICLPRHLVTGLLAGNADIHQLLTCQEDIARLHPNNLIGVLICFKEFLKFRHGVLEIGIFFVQMATAQSTYLSLLTWFFLRNVLPALLLTKLRDMRGMMFPMPLVKEEQPINRALAVFGVNEDPCEMFGFQ